MQPEVSIVTVNWNGMCFLKDFFDSVKSQLSKNTEVIMVDNGSNDGSVEFVRKNYPFVRIVEVGKNVGFSPGCNIGYSKSKADFVLISGNDTILPKDFIKNMLKEMKERKIAILASNDFPVGSDLTQIKALDTINIICGNSLGIINNFDESVVPRCVTFLADKKRVGKKLFDDDYWSYGEDTWLGFRLLLKGEGCYYSKSAKVWHHGAGTGSRVPTISFFTERNRLLNIFTFLSVWTILKIFPVMFFDFFIKLFSFIFSLNFKRLMNFLKAYGWILLNFVTVIKKRAERQRERKLNDDILISKMSCKLYGYQRSHHNILAAFMDKIISAYCRLVGLRVYEIANGA